MKAENQNQELYCDLHMHTRYSDGIAVDPKDLVNKALGNGIDVFAITDHDYDIGYHIAKDYAERKGIVLLPGAEITTSRYHLLALNFDPNDNYFKKFLKNSRDLQGNYYLRCANYFESIGIPINSDKVLKRFPRARIGKLNVWITMQEDEECNDYLEKNFNGLSRREASEIFFSRATNAGFRRKSVRARNAIKAVHDAGGLIGIAHPSKDIREEWELDNLVVFGIDFLEIQPQSRGKESGPYSTDFFEDYAKTHTLPITYGSDYHGPTMDRELLGKGENVMSKELIDMLNKGHAKIDIGSLEEACSC